MVAMMPENLRKSLAEQIPFPARFGQPAEFAKLAIHMFENSFLNGETIRLDGAVRMGPR
jgi:NAD(P)-dependent dehydrogenase (short-subunit alcohol dehydrogenase family)